MTILAEVKALNQQIWLDNVSRTLIRSGKLETLLRAGVCGVTSNPAIFQKAFASDDSYAPDIAALKHQGKTAQEIYESLAIADVQTACDVFREEFDSSGGQSGFVSLEVSPDLAHDSAQTLAQALRLHTEIARPNIMIKIPATDAGLNALTELIAAGVSINLTLLFSRQQTRKAYNAYREGLRQRVQAGQSVRNIHMVASFFISRIDAALDATLPTHLKGKTAIALAKTAYEDWQHYFHGENFADLNAQNANPARLLWASTGVKNPDYSATYYVENLMGAHTINTVPEATLNAFMAHGKISFRLPEDTPQAHQILNEIAQLGIDVETLASRLQHDGLKQFEEAFDALLKAL